MSREKGGVLVIPEWNTERHWICAPINQSVVVVVCVHNDVLGILMKGFWVAQVRHLFVAKKVESSPNVEMDT